MSSPLVSRAEAGLEPPRRVTRNPHAEMLTAHWYGDSPWGRSIDRATPDRFLAATDHARCPTIWRGTQQYHYRPGTNAADVFYNSAVCPHGYRFEGRGPGVLTGANGTPEGNRRSHAVLYLAGQGDPLTDPAAAGFLAEEGRYGLLILRDHSQWKPTACAGPVVRAWIAGGKPAPTPTPPEPIPAPVRPSEATDMPTLLFDSSTWECWFSFGGGVFADARADEHVLYFAPAEKLWHGPFESSHAMRYIVAKAREDAERLARLSRPTSSGPR